MDDDTEMRHSKNYTQVQTPIAPVSIEAVCGSDVKEKRRDHRPDCQGEHGRTTWSQCRLSRGPKHHPCGLSNFELIHLVPLSTHLAESNLRFATKSSHWFRLTLRQKSGSRPRLQTATSLVCCQTKVSSVARAVSKERRPPVSLSS